MPLENTSLQTHPVGEPNFPAPSRTPAWPVDTPGGRYYAEFDHSTPTAREGQLIFFAQFLKPKCDWVSRQVDGGTPQPVLRRRGQGG